MQYCDGVASWCAARAGNCVRQACEGGALRFLADGLLGSVPFADDSLLQRELTAQAVHQLLMIFLDAEPGRCVSFPTRGSLTNRPNNMLLPDELSELLAAQNCLANAIAFQCCSGLHGNAEGLLPS